MTHRMGAQGQVVIPSRLGERQGMAPVTTISFQEREDGVLIRATGASGSLRGRYGRSGMAGRLLRIAPQSLVDQLPGARAVLAWLDGEEPAPTTVQEASMRDGR